ncbi:hypothetical protein DPMN_089711 [Dreissena polymorpha]|uniref:Uncharacterized protein n=1 Tax=Dreissena polymorpha TaxID=45954 RepID=A0A9D4KWY4_DREPO|nr:hypothetical protein DPMN_089711 [Dreissena polymorpha]
MRDHKKCLNLSPRANTYCGSSGLMVGRWRRDREVPGSNPALTAVISLSKKFVPHLLLSTQVYKWVPVREISQCAVAAWCAIC